jgi:CAAX protease family protein
MIAVNYSTHRNQLLWLEFVALYVLAPLILAFLLPPEMMLTVLALFTLLGCWLLHRTAGFDWRRLLVGWSTIPAKVLVVFIAVTVVSCFSLVALFFPWRMLELPLNQTLVWLGILAFYPLLSVLPQEVVFRPLFFDRYGGLFPGIEVAVALNAVVFSLAHLMYWHWIVLAMTFAGGVIFGWAYGVKRNFPLALVMHAIAGQIIFTSGLGYLFYSGGVS